LDRRYRDNIYNVPANRVIGGFGSEASNIATGIPYNAKCCIGVTLQSASDETVRALRFWYYGRPELKFTIGDHVRLRSSRGLNTNLEVQNDKGKTEKLLLAGSGYVSGWIKTMRGITGAAQAVTVAKYCSDLRSKRAIAATAGDLEDLQACAANGY
jgi:hypothetical protein